MPDRKRQILDLLRGRDTIRAGLVADELQVTRQTAHRYLAELVDDGILAVEGAGRGTRYRRSGVVDSARFATAGLAEDRAWADVSATGSVAATLEGHAAASLHYVFTELVNNAIDHSGAPEVSVDLSGLATTVALEVHDDGVGLFRHVRDRLGLDSTVEALQELSKGKVTTMPERHTGEGLFFTSKVADRFEVRSGALHWIVDNRVGDVAVGELEIPDSGTTVRVEIDRATQRSLDAVFRAHTIDLEFSRTRTIVRLFAIGTEFVSRSEAKRLARGLDRFREVIVDFAGVRLVGQGFVDELFRVWATAHPGTRLIPIAMSEPVAFMVERGRRTTDRGSRSATADAPPPISGSDGRL